jgi:hypothetical protein
LSAATGVTVIAVGQAVAAVPAAAGASTVGTPAESKVTVAV